MNTLLVTGAYGRRASKADWLNGLDFQIYNRGAYFSIRDCKLLKQDGYTHITFLDSNGVPSFTLELK